MTKYEALKKYFGYENFKPVQEEIIEEILNGNNVLAVLPTGAGKSLCYQIPSIISESFSIVVSPLIALMKDQVDSLNKIEKIASFINSSLEEKESEKVFQELTQGQIKILYVSPEKLQNKFFAERIKNLKPNFIFIDEAHCISEWGHNFRPSYRKINDFIEFCEIKKISAFTATATEEVRNDILKLLKIPNAKIFVKGFERNNLALKVFTNIDKKEKTLEILRTNKTPAIIYTSTRKYCEEVAEFLKKNFIKATYYHAGLAANLKKIIQDDFISNRVEVIVATNAFGMGIDKNNIRTIIHFNLPGSIENYYQEIGRAGRDGINSNIFLLYDRKDRDIQDYFIESANPTRDQIELVYDAICDHGKIALGFINEKGIEFNKQLSTLFDLKDLSKAVVESSINVLQNSGYLIYKNQLEKDSFVKILLEKNHLYSILKNEMSQEEKDIIALFIKIFSNSIFEKKQKINIEQIARQLEASTNLVIEYLNKLSNDGIIEFEQSSFYPTIYLKTPRVRSKDLKLDMKKIQETYQYHKKKLEKMIDYVFTEKCRMNYIINYFGQKDENYKCGLCDICTDSKVNNVASVDYLEEIIMKTLHEMRRPIRKILLIKILKGNAEPMLFKNISYFGSCNHFSKDELESTIDKLISKKMIVLFKDTIKLTDDGLELFITPKEIVQNESYENDLELFNMIRNIRKEAAEKFNQPATMICPDEILLKISKAKPKTYTELMNIDGFTQRMFNKIGEAILNEIKNKTSNPFEDETSKLIIDLIRKKYSFEDILSLTKLPESILASRIESIISFARELNFNYLIQPKEMKVIKAKYDAGFLDLRELFNELGKKISYNKLKVAVKILQTN